MRLRIQNLEGKKANSVDPDEAAHNESPHVDLHCLLLQQFFFGHFKSYCISSDIRQIFFLPKRSQRSRSVL